MMLWRGQTSFHSVDCVRELKENDEHCQTIDPYLVIAVSQNKTRHNLVNDKILLSFQDSLEVVQ